MLAILADGFEEIELTTPVDLMRRAGITVTLAALGEGIHVKGRTGITVHADTTIEAVLGESFDCVFLPGGPGVRQFTNGCPSESPSCPSGGLSKVDCRNLRRSSRSKRCRASIWQAFYFPLVHVCRPPTRLGHERVVLDVLLLTSRGAGTALEFGFALVEHLVSTEKAAEIAKSICA